MGQVLWQVLPEVAHLILSPPETGAILIPILQVSQLRLREGKSLSPGQALTVAELGLKPELACARDHCTTQPLPFWIFICLGYGKQVQDKEMNTVTFC